MPKLSQHFLSDKSIAERMVKYAEVSSEDIVLEIGPGKGTITKKIMEKAKEVIAIEKDASFKEILPKDKKLKLIIGDFLKVELPKFDKVISNLPFEISSPATFKLFKYPWDVAIMIYQKEFAQRFVALPGSKNYSRLTVGINYYAEPEILEKVPKSRFIPQPKVECVIVRLKKKEPSFKTNKFFWELVNKLFQHRKKTVKAALKVSKFASETIEKVPEKLLVKKSILV